MEWLEELNKNIENLSAQLEKLEKSKEKIIFIAWPGLRINEPVCLRAASPLVNKGNFFKNL